MKKLIGFLILCFALSGTVMAKGQHQGWDNNNGHYSSHYNKHDYRDHQSNHRNYRKNVKIDRHHRRDHYRPTKVVKVSSRRHNHHNIAGIVITSGLIGYILGNAH
ncbi:MAG: hypothetical protein HQL46_03055 [Gammaproteobacteria bacterium]|nr:hypothetical protein [Gammaproteobacteria bacterium]